MHNLEQNILYLFGEESILFLPGIRACIFHAGGRVPKKQTLIWQRASEITPIESHRNVKARNTYFYGTFKSSIRTKV